MKNWRFNIILVFVFIASGIILSRLAFIQIIKAGFYKAQALGQQTRLEEATGERGEIFFNNGEKILAFNKSKWRVYIVPRKIKDKASISSKLSRLLKKEEKEILSEIEKGTYYSVLKNDLSTEEIKLIKKQDLPGVYLEEYPGRYYPQEKLASHISGFVDWNGNGQYGVEGYYNEALQGEKGFREERRGILEHLLKSNSGDSIKDGKDLYLTIDYNLQFKAESLLEKAKENFNIESGQIIVSDPKTGRVEVLANLPNYNPNHYSKQKDLEVFQSGAIHKVFEPGSVFKPFTMAAALNEGKITPDTTYKDKGSVTLNGETIYNYDRRVWGTASMTEVLEKSINTGAVFAERKVPHHIFSEYINAFDFNKKTNVGLQGEAAGFNQNLRGARDIKFATTSFGQGINMTPIQLVKAFSAIANGGKLMRPYLVEKIVDQSGEEDKIEPKVVGQPISSKTSSQLTSMLMSVVENGFAKKAKVPGYYIAGKTGTAQVPFEGKSGYHPNKTIQSFVGFAPALNPEFLILVKLNNPEIKTAEYSAVPIFKEMAEYIINYKQIPPDYEE